jgi:PKD repeat protein
VRFDPETFVTTNGPIIYYTHVIDGVPVLRRTQTGLTPAAPEAPVASFTATPNPAAPGANIDYDGAASTDADGEIVSWDWDFEDDGVFDANGVQVVASYPAAGSYTVRLRVTDDEALTGETTMTIEVVEQP